MSTQKLRLDKGYLEINKSTIKLKPTREEKERYKEANVKEVRKAQSIAFNKVDYLSGKIQSDIIEYCYVDKKNCKIDSYPVFLNILRENSLDPGKRIGMGKN